MANGEAESVLGYLPASRFQPGGVLVRAGDDQHLIGRKLPQRVFDRAHWIGITDLGLHIRGWGRLGGLVGESARVGASVVLGVRQPIEPRDARGGSDHPHLSVLADSTPNELAQRPV